MKKLNIQKVFHKKKKVKKEKPQRRERKTWVKILVNLLWLGFFAFVVYAFIFTFNLTNDFVMDRSEIDIAALVGEISEEEAIIIDIPSGSSTKDISKQLANQGIISDKILIKWYQFELYSMLMGNDGGYTSGKHYINKNIDYDNPIGYDMLIHIFSLNPVPNPTARIFFQEGLTFKQTVERFVENGFVSEEQFIKACNEYEFEYDFVESIPTIENREFFLEGYLFPDTYIFDITTGAEAAIEKMLGNFDKKLKDVYIKRANEIGMSIDDIVIIASLIEKEARVDEERGIIAGVIYNRLNTSDTSLNYLQIDATIQYYLLNETGEVKEELLTEDIQIETPYNTYLYAGLPPGPICNPGEKSIIAALFPDEHNYYFYVSKGDGTHAFASTLKEHNNNKIRYAE